MTQSYYKVIFKYKNNNPEEISLKMYQPALLFKMNHPYTPYFNPIFIIPFSDLLWRKQIKFTPPTL